MWKIGSDPMGLCCITREVIVIHLVSIDTAFKTSDLLYTSTIYSKLR